MPLIEAHELGITFPTRPQRYMKDVLMKVLFRKQEVPNNVVWKDVNFHVKEGELLCVIGKNGRGKSTLLKIVAGLLRPDFGTIQVHSKHILLLAAGLGFDERLTGRENIFYAGIFLGLKKKEMIARYEEIVAFSELEEHIDKPFKYYSDGMKARLVFSTATSVRPEILLLDELLSAGDLAFQEKASKRLDELFKTVGCAILVTHSIEFARRNSTKILYLGDRQYYYGTPDEAIRLYKEELGIS